MVLLRVPRTKSPRITVSIRQFSTTKENKAKNRIYNPVRNFNDFDTYRSISTSNRIPLLTLWTASYCNVCKTVSPVLEELIKSGVGEEEGGVSYCEVEYDSQDIMDSGLGLTYMITSMPTLLSIDRGEPRINTRIVDPKKMTNKDFMREWIRTEARNGGSGGGGGVPFGPGMFGGLFGNTQK
ncbi:hypothetical protein B0J14DRAFT_484097 [Halenospora varia]|nr:hypothetical protein B0J14DRAFT_484097 [Halenospora varia]